MNAFCVADPSVTRYHVQWLPEYCSHNETRGPEKSVTQVSPRPSALPAAFVRRDAGAQQHGPGEHAATDGR